MKRDKEFPAKLVDKTGLYGDEHQMTLGKIYTIFKVEGSKMDNTDMWYVKQDNGVEYGFYSYRFIKLNPLEAQLHLAKERLNGK